ncbi:unnamed protein product, partial [Ectocarpus sp. 8 AP-2014]
YVPSSSAADDYLDSLKADSQKKQKETQAKLRGEPLPPREGPLLSASPPTETATSDVPDKSAAPLPSGEDYERVKPQKRTAASWSIQNKADQYMASLKGIKVELADDNPYLKKESLVEEPQQPVRRPPPPAPKPPLGPQMSYAEKLKLAKGAKAPGTATAAAPSSNVVAAPVATLPPATEAPPPPAPSSGSPALSYAEKLKQAQAEKAAAGNGVAPKSVPPPPPPPAAAAAVAPASRRLLEQDIPSGGLVDEGDSQAKMVKVMGLLTEHKTAGLEGEDRVSELRHSLVDAREALRAETYGRSTAAAAAPTAAKAPAATAPAATASSTPMPPPPPPPQPRVAAAPSPPSPQQQQQPARPAPPAPPTTSPEDAATLRRCSALLQAHVHSGLAGQDLQALVEGLASSLTIVTAQVVTGTATAAAAAGGGASGAPPAAGADDTGVPAYAGGIQSVGGALSDMGVAKKPASFLPEEGEGDGSAGWTGGSLGEEEKAAASKALGYLLKHRGGKGYGRGRVTGTQAEAMVAALAEVTEIMEEEMVEE